MHNILIGRPSFNDWVGFLDKIVGRSGGRLHMRDFDSLDEVVSYARRFRMQAVVPTTYPQMRMVAKHRDKFAAFGCRVACSENFEFVDIFDDKVRFVRFMDDSGLAHMIPEVYVIQHEGEREERAPISYPCIFKLAVTFGGTGSSVHLSPDKPPPMDKTDRATGFLVQEYIPGNVEYGGHFYIENGAVKKQLYYRTKRDASVLVQRGAMGTYDRLESIPEGGEFENIFGAINYTGFACIDFKVTDDGPKIFEINPRLGGTLLRNESDLLAFFEAIFD